MLDASVIRLLAGWVPVLFTGRVLHRAALHATVAGAYREADVLFERAAARYRQDLEVEGLARLRVHQLIARARATGVGRDEAASLEVEQRLTRLDLIESLTAPFDLVPARRLLASWMGASAAASPSHAPGAPGAGLSSAA